MALRHGFTIFFLLFLGLLVTPAVASEDSLIAPHAASESGHAVAPHKSEEEQENDIWKTDAVTGAKTDTINAGKLFGKIIEHLWDSYELHIIGTRIPLPILFTDAFGFHFFSGPEELEHSEVYRFRESHVYAEEKGKVLFGCVNPWERLDGKPMGFTLDLSLSANRF
ncbi:MAG: hypothetical protein ABI778_07315, partial [Ignavibacteriota bacterium]